MKKIQPVQIWVNGKLKTATILNAACIADNLKDTANFFYQLFENDENSLPIGNAIASGNISMIGQDYEQWNANPDINEAAYIWIATQLVLTLI